MLGTEHRADPSSPLLSDEELSDTSQGHRNVFAENIATQLQLLAVTLSGLTSAPTGSVLRGSNMFSCCLDVSTGERVEHVFLPFKGHSQI